MRGSYLPIAVVILVGLAAPPLRAQRHDPHGMREDVRQLRGLKGARLERAYLTMMQDHHASGIEMARLAVEKTQNRAIKRLAERMVAVQAKENEQMHAYLNWWHRLKRDPKPDPRMQDSLGKLHRLTGPAFDRAFVTRMVAHHEGAIQMSGPVRRGAPHAEVRQLATRIVAGQRREQQELKQALHTR